MAESSDEYRRNAEDCRAQAAKSVRKDDKVRWLKLAEGWQNLAEATDSGTFRSVLTPVGHGDRQRH
jgi:hypothetical protein